MNNYSDLQAIADSMVDDQVMSMLSDLIIEWISQNSAPKEEIFVNISPLNAADSFDDQDSLFSSSQNNEHLYDYSPKYVMMYDNQKMPQTYQIEIDESEYNIDYEDIPNYETINNQIDKYKIDTSKIHSKMEDVGCSPYKLRSQESEEEYTDAICFHCGNVIHGNNINIHSQYWNGSKEPFMDKPQVSEYSEVDKLEFVNSELSNVDGVTIPRINQQLYKLLKALKNKEIEWIGSNKEIKFLQSLQGICKDLMVNNIDLQKLESTGEKLQYLTDTFEANHTQKYSKQGKSILIIAHIMHQIFWNKVILIQQEDEWSYENDLANAMFEDNDQNFESPIVLNKKKYQYQLYENSNQVSYDPESNNESDEIKRQEEEIKMWKKIHKEMSKRLKESKIFGLLRIK